jgi:hypothetical protein
MTAGAPTSAINTAPSGGADLRPEALGAVGQLGDSFVAPAGHGRGIGHLRVLGVVRRPAEQPDDSDQHEQDRVGEQLGGVQQGHRGEYRPGDQVTAGAGDPRSDPVDQRPAQYHRRLRY